MYVCIHTRPINKFANKVVERKFVKFTKKPPMTNQACIHHLIMFQRLRTKSLNKFFT